MFVITDIEWMTNEVGHHSPTQLAAIRVDETWKKVDSFESFIRPRDSTFHDWNHISYTGGSPTEFMNARNAHNVINAFEKWLNDDDIILWWSDESNKIFKKLVSFIFNTKEPHNSITIKEYVYEFLSGQLHYRGNAYQIAEYLGIETGILLKHNSINDAIVIQKLMANVAYPQSDLLKPLVITEKPMLSGEHFDNLPLQYDPLTNTIHKRDCELLASGEIITQGYENWKTPLRKGYKPCECCKEEYRTAFRERNIDIIDRTQYNYIYSPESKVFHKCTCGLMLSAKHIMGTVKYDSVIKTGRIPCKICIPTANDTLKPIPTKQKIAQIQKKIKHTVSREGAQAIERQKRALLERQQMLKDDDLTDTERNDAYTLTQTRFAFWVGQGYQTFHLRSCSKLQGVSNLRGFSTYKDAVRAGYTPCRKCKPTAKNDVIYSIPINNRLRVDEKVEDIEALCADAGYPYYRDGEYFCLSTPVGKWKLDISTVPIKLQHINLVRTPGVNKYHEQPRLFLSFIDTFDYIKRHDDNLEAQASKGKVYVRFIGE